MLMLLRTLFTNSRAMVLRVLPGHNPDEQEQNGVLFTAEYAKNAEIFFIPKFFFSAISALSAVQKMFCRKMAGF
jgi:hypothetical protein